MPRQTKDLERRRVSTKHGNALGPVHKLYARVGLLNLSLLLGVRTQDMPSIFKDDRRRNEPISANPTPGLALGGRRPKRTGRIFPPTALRHQAAQLQYSRELGKIAQQTELSRTGRVKFCAKATGFSNRSENATAKRISSNSGSTKCTVTARPCNGYAEADFGNNRPASTFNQPAEPGDNRE